MNKTKIMLQRKNSIIVEPKSTEQVLPLNYTATLMKNIEALGYTLSGDVIEVLNTYTVEEASKFYKSLIKDIKDLTGASKMGKPMYPNFPKQVMEADQAELYLNAIFHYTGDKIGARIMPNYDVEERPELADTFKLKVINLATERDFHTVFSNLMNSSTSISSSDTEQLQEYIETYKDAIVLPETIPHKEILSVVFKSVLKHTTLSTDELSKYFKTATDVLRLAVAMSDGDVSLAENTKFRNFSRKERRVFLGLLDNIKHPQEDMLRNKTKWVRLGEKIHPGEYKSRFQNAFKSFDAIRNNHKIETFGGKVESLLAEGNSLEAVELLSKRPGELARRLDHLIRLSPGNHSYNVAEAFDKVANDVSVPVLLQVKEHFAHRNDDKDLRVVFPKGNVGRVQSLENNLAKIKQSVCNKIVASCESALKNHFKDRGSLGKVYLDKSLSEQLVPFSQRSASESLRTLVRGSKIEMPEGDTLRFFIHWKDLNGDGYNRVDLDLSAVLYDENWEYKEHISYTNLKSAKYQACHSGDITSAPNGANEYIDINMDSVLKYGGRYVVMEVYSYTNQPIGSVPEACGGWMIRENPQSGEIFDARTVQDKIDITANTKIVIPMVFDLQERKMIWTDLAISHRPNHRINVESNERSVALMAKSINELVKPNLYDLFKLHCEAREAEFVETLEEADTVFSINEGVTPFDVDTIMSDFL